MPAGSHTPRLKKAGGDGPQNNVLEFGPAITPRTDFMKKRLDAFDEVLHLLDHFR